VPPGLFVSNIRTGMDFSQNFKGFWLSTSGSAGTMNSHHMVHGARHFLWFPANLFVCMAILN